MNLIMREKYKGFAIPEEELTGLRNAVKLLKTRMYQLLVLVLGHFCKRG